MHQGDSTTCLVQELGFLQRYGRPWLPSGRSHDKRLRLHEEEEEEEEKSNVCPRRKQRASYHPQRDSSKQDTALCRDVIRAREDAAYATCSLNHPDSPSCALYHIRHSLSFFGLSGDEVNHCTIELEGDHPSLPRWVYGGDLDYISVPQPWELSYIWPTHGNIIGARYGSHGWVTGTVVVDGLVP